MVRNKYKDAGPKDSVGQGDVGFSCLVILLSGGSGFQKFANCYYYFYYYYYYYYYYCSCYYYFSISTIIYTEGGVRGGESMHIVEARVFCILYFKAFYLLLKC